MACVVPVDGDTFKLYYARIASQAVRDGKEVHRSTDETFCKICREIECIQAIGRSLKLVVEIDEKLLAVIGNRTALTDLIWKLATVPRIGASCDSGYNKHLQRATIEHGNQTDYTLAFVVLEFVMSPRHVPEPMDGDFNQSPELENKL
jgi:hypothetical protein